MNSTMQDLTASTRFVSAAIVLAAALLFGASPAAYADSSEVIRDCAEDGVLNGHYSQGELQGALNGLPSDVDEYTDCRSVIRQATLTKASGGGGSNPKASVGKIDRNAPTSADEQRRVDDAAKSKPPVTIAGKRVPGDQAGFEAAALESHVPSLLFAVLVMFAVATVAGSALLLQHRLPRVAYALAWPFRQLSSGARRGISRFRD